MQLNPQQEEAANHREGACLCTAVPGSGKTRVIVERIARMIQGGIDPKSILAITFTNKAATEMKERVMKRVGEESAKKIFISTFHRLSSTILRYHGKWIGYDPNMTILDEDDQISFMSQTARQLGHELTKPEIKVIAHATNDWREKLGDDDDLYERFEKMEKIHFYSISTEYLKRINAANMIDFSGMLSETYRLLKDFPQVLEAAQKKWKYFMVDEVQDTNLAQFKIVDLLCNHTKNIFVVGDTDQCQPAGTKILTTSHGEVPIEELDPVVHKLVSFSTRQSIIIGRKNGISFKKAERRSFGYLHTIKIGPNETKCTPNHKWTVKLKKDIANKHLVYIMRSGDYWRVGHTSAFRSYGSKSKGAFGPIMRARQEQCDAVWVLKVCNSESEAQLWEQITSCKYGIPTTCFTSGRLMDNLSNLYKEIEPVEYRIKNCMNEYKLWMDQPIWEKREELSPDFGKRIPFKVHASNLIPDLMQIPIPIKGKEFVWSDFSMTTDEYHEGSVYSLDVEKYGHYIADGIVTHNSIYGWRGARIENVTDFQKNYNGKVISLGKNYRSTPQIIAIADKLIRHNDNRIDVKFSTDNPDGVPVGCNAFGTDLQEADTVAKTVKAIIASGRYCAKDIAIFYRMNSMSRAIEMACIANKVPHTVIGNFSFFDRKEIKDAMAMLRFLTNPKDGISFHRIANKPKRSLGDTTVGKIELYAKDHDCSIMQAMKEMTFTSKGITEGMNEVVHAYDFDYANMTIAQCLNHLIVNLRYEEHLKDDDEDTFADRWDNIQELIKDAARYSEESGSQVAQYLDHIALSTSSDKNADGDAASLMSLHASKGLEFPVVFMLGVEQNILPHKRAVEEREDGIEEERRLCYVGMTRAKNILSVSYCQRRQDGFAATKGKVNYKLSLPSQFLTESGLLKAKPKPMESQASDFTDKRKVGFHKSSWDHTA